MQRITQRLCAPVSADLDESSDLRQAAALLRAGGTVAFATETVYGLGANALEPAAVARIFEAKGRPAWDPLIVHVSNVEQVLALAGHVTPCARKLMQLWPGPLTMLLPRTAAVPDLVTAGRDKVGIRIPAHPVARQLLAAAGVPVAAPSANRFGHVSPTTAAHVLADLDGRIDAVLDSGPTQQGVESTVVEPTEDGCVVYRHGAVPVEVLRMLVPRVQVYAPPAISGEPRSLPSPGVGIRHYAPRARLQLVEPPEALAAALRDQVAQRMRTGLMLPRGLELTLQHAEREGAAAVVPWGEWTDAASLARELYASLRALDEQAVDVILCPLPPEQGVGAAVVDRLRKAARRS